jgi:peptidoglycan/xylan/chitin deacetylase (PgdA/CDA1 family)
LRQSPLGRGIMQAGLLMDDSQTGRPHSRTVRAFRKGARPGAPRSPLAPHHRRRRLTALAAAAALALLIGLVAGAGAGSGPSPRPHRVASGSARPGSAGRLPTGYFARVKILAGGGPRSFAAAERTAEDAAIDRTIAYTPFVRVAGRQHREIALTFDDGPGPYTPQVLAVLERQHVPATFFEVGISEQYFHASTTAIVNHGYVIGDHTMDHAPMSKLSPATQQSQLLQQTAAIGQYGAPFPRLFRPPYGLWDNATLKLLKRYRMLMVLWTVDTEDYTLPGVKAIIDRALQGARPGAIILLHDAGGERSETVAALPSIIRGLRRRHYKLVTVPRLLLDNPAPAHQNIYSMAGGGG